MHGDQGGVAWNAAYGYDERIIAGGKVRNLDAHLEHTG
jgi:hypothetical protein